ncbi:MAG: hypothetical protein KJ606_04990 [Chloroflexi bacterium]|nr:hypothetical protein [Chloroflexota bacterium]
MTMPQLTKGGKWVFGWAIVGPGGGIRIPPQAYAEYGFQPGEPVFFLRGSRRSGGFGIGRRERLAQAQIPLPRRAFGQGTLDETGQVALPPEAGVKSGDRLLVVRGSGLALGFLQRGPIFEEAHKYPEVEIFNA